MELLDKIKNHLDELKKEEWVYGNFSEIRDKEYTANNILKDVMEVYGWKSVSSQEPPKHIELLVKSPEGIIHLASWREAYNIFTCQDKAESSYDWQWKLIE